MPVFEGTTSGSVLQVAMNIPSKILSGSVTNNTAGSVTINIPETVVNVVSAILIKF